MKLTKKIVSLMLAVMMLLSLVACGGNNNSADYNNSQAANQEQNTTQETLGDTQQPAEEDYNGKLVSDGMMDIKYAEQFTIEKFKGGYRLVTDNLSGSKILVVPEGMSVPAELDAETQVLQLPVTNSYVCGSNMVAMIDSFGAIEKVTQVGSETTWHFQSIIDQLDSGHTQFAGGYTTDPDYEMISTGGTQIVIWNGYEEEVFDKFRSLDIVVLCEENTNELGIYGRIEWIKLLGVIYSMEDEANAYFDDQVAQIETVQSEGPTDQVVGIGGISSSGKYYSRKSGDFQADYVRFAGGTYNLEDVDVGVGGSLTMTPEDFYLRFKDVDILIWNFSATGNLETLLEVYPSIVDFKAYQNGRLYIQSDNFIQSAGNPACIVRDIHTILTSDDPEVTTDHILKMPQTAGAE